MTIRHLRIFKAVCDCGSMTSATKKLFMTQPAISQAVKELEDYYGTVLFERYSKKLYLTNTGERLYGYATHIIDLFDETGESLAASETEGCIKVGANITIGTTMIHKYINEFKKFFPNATVKVWVKNSKTLYDLLLQNKLDFALLEDNIDKTLFISKVFCDDRIAIISSPNHHLVSKENIVLLDLLNEPFLIREQGSGVRNAFEGIAAIHDIKFNVIWESSSTKALVNAAIQGFGLAVLPYMLTKEYIDNGLVTEIKVLDINLSRELNVVYHKNKFLSNMANKFIEIVIETEK